MVLHKSPTLALLLSRRFGTFWLASLLSNIGTWAQQVAQPWLMLSLGASPMLLGLDNFALGAPVLLLTLLGGALADRTDRRKTIFLFQFAQMWCPVLIVGLLWAHAIQPWMVVGLSLVVGITDALSMPSFQSIVGTLVPREQMPTAIALNSTQFNLSRILGPAIAGVLMASVGALGAFSVSALSYVPFLAVALWILPRHGVRRGAEAPLSLQALKASVRQVLGQPVLRWALLSVSVNSVLCAPLIAFCPVLVRDALHGDVAEFSTAAAAFGVGGMLGALGLLALGPQHDRRRLCAWFGMLFAALVLLAGRNQVLALLPAMFVLAGIGMTVSNTSANTLIQSQAPLHIRGQAVSMFMLAMRGGIALGALLTGALVSGLGVQTALLINGALAMLAHLLVAWRGSRVG